jgi:hypothetical protein
MASLFSDPRRAVLSRLLQVDRRQAERYALSLSVEVLTTDGVPLAAELSNISSSGFRARSPIALSAGTRLVVRFGGRMPRKAIVAWQKGEEIGCRFLRPLGLDQLAEVSRR